MSDDFLVRSGLTDWNVNDPGSQSPNGDDSGKLKAEPHDIRAGQRRRQLAGNVSAHSRDPTGGMFARLQSDSVQSLPEPTACLNLVTPFISSPALSPLVVGSYS